MLQQDQWPNWRPCVQLWQRHRFKGSDRTWRLTADIQWPGVHHSEGGLVSWVTLHNWSVCGIYALYGMITCMTNVLHRDASVCIWIWPHKHPPECMRGRWIVWWVWKWVTGSGLHSHKGSSGSCCSCVLSGCCILSVYCVFVMIKHTLYVLIDWFHQVLF